MSPVFCRAIVERWHEDALELLTQTVKITEESSRIQLPGGCSEVGVPLFETVRRCIFEETGLEVIDIEGALRRTDTSLINPKNPVECLKPFAVYQTLKSPKHETGLYFRCKAVGEITERPDKSVSAEWTSVADLRKLLQENTQVFSEVDLAGLEHYLCYLKEEVPPKVTFYPLESVADHKLRYAVTMARYEDKWIFARHESRDSWEIPGGRREPGEPILDTAHRELYEETGAKTFNLTPLSLYSVAKEGQKTYGLLSYATVEELGELPNLEIVETLLADEMPNHLTYPHIQPILYQYVTQLYGK